MKILAVCRAFYIRQNRIEIGDLWLNPELRGKRSEKGVKYSVEFMRNVISKTWKLFKRSTLISLQVQSHNVGAIRLYETLGFHKSKSLGAILELKNSFVMERRKKLPLEPTPTHTYK